MRVLRNPILQFLAVGLVTVAAIVVGTSYLAGDAASQEAVAEARDTTRLVARTIVAPQFQPGLLNTSPSSIDRMDRTVIHLLKIGDISHCVLLDSTGRVLYADDISRINSRVQLDAAHRRVLREGGTGARRVEEGQAGPSGLPGYRATGPQLLTWTRIRPQNSEPVLFEAYFSLGQVDNRQQAISSSFRWISVGPLLLLMVVVTVMLRLLTRQLTRAGEERERLLRSAIDASDAERRRIARDLHDGVVQDLAGTAFSVSALARDPAVPEENRTSLQVAARSLRAGLKSLRSLLAEIHPPDLRAAGLAAALTDLTAPAAGAGIRATVRVDGVEGASDERVALVWRVAQEAVRNALRHSAATTLTVTVCQESGVLHLEVNDDGVGFDPAGAGGPDSFGLRGLRSLVDDAGGTLEVRSSPGSGTRVCMEVDAR
ncbi:histidine kinase [Nocardioides panaciterrulae]|uniref:Signal transduction histidine kinase n=1 Tax=Nocardioides panaciterrulae TaxID=661492 RepID=A0A7Y9E5Z7_9ACTN|nr:signal transduction histidine kinase [Nocardioides panaciterrulae]